MGARHRWKALPQHRLLTTSTACGARPIGNSTASRGPQQDGLALDKNVLVRANNRWSEPTMIDPVSRTFCQCKVCQSHKCWAPSAFFRRGCTQQASSIQCCTICTERRSHTQQHSNTGTTWCTALVPHHGSVVIPIHPALAVVAGILQMICRIPASILQMICRIPATTASAGCMGMTTEPPQQASRTHCCSSRVTLCVKRNSDS